jgi:hypothetical protein
MRQRQRWPTPTNSRRINTLRTGIRFFYVVTIGLDTPILAVSEMHDANRDATAGVLVRTFWTLGDFRCVLVRAVDRLSVQVFINERPFLTEPSKDAGEATGQAEALFAVFSGAHSTLQRG